MNRQTDGQSYRQCSQFNRFPYIITYHSLLLLAHIFINSFQRLVFVSPYSVIFSFCQLTLQLDGCVAKFNILVSARAYFPHLQIVSFGVQKLNYSSATKTMHLKNPVCWFRLLHVKDWFQHTVWTQIRLLQEEQSDLGPHCLLPRRFKGGTSRRPTEDDNLVSTNLPSQLIYNHQLVPNGLLFFPPIFDLCNKK